MKKAFALVSALTLAAGTAVGLAACEETPADDTPEAHTHTYGEWTVETPATLFTAGSEYRVCTADDCDAEDKGREEQAIPALGTTSAVIDAFTGYNDGLTAAADGVTMGRSESGSGANTWLGQDDKLTEFDGTNETSFSFTLDLSSLEEGDYTIFSLAFGNKHSNTDGSPAFSYVTEAIFGVIRTEDGYTVARITNVSYAEDEYTDAENPENNRPAVSQEQADAQNVETINASDTTYDVTGDSVTFTYTYSYDAGATENKLNVSLSVNGDEAFAYDNILRRDADMEGAGYLWNCNASVDTVVLSNLVKE